MIKMKWIFAILLLVSATAFGQVDDTTKYISYPYQYGMKIPRIWAPTTMIMPYGDTTGKRPGKIGAFMTCSCDGNVYRWNGSNWVAFGGSGSATLSNVGSGFRRVTTPSGSIKTDIFGYGLNGDSTSTANTITINADTTELVTPSDLKDTAAAIRGITTLDAYSYLGNVTNSSAPGTSLHYNIYNALDFGLVDDSLTDNTTALRSLLTLIPDGASLYFPGRGKGYLLSDSIVIDKSITVFGDGDAHYKFYTVVHQPSKGATNIFFASNTSNCFILKSSATNKNPVINIRDLTIFNNDTTSNKPSGAGILVADNIGGSNIKNITIGYFHTDVKVRSGNYVDFQNCSFVSPWKYSVDLGNIGEVDLGVFKFDNVNFFSGYHNSGDSLIGLIFRGGGYVDISHCHFNAQGVYNYPTQFKYQLYTTFEQGQTSDIIIANNLFENYHTNAIRLTNSSGLPIYSVKVTGNMISPFNQSQLAYNAIYVDGPFIDISLIDNGGHSLFSSPSTSTFAFMKVNNCDQLRIQRGTQQGWATYDSVTSSTDAQHVLYTGDEDVNATSTILLENKNTGSSTVKSLEFKAGSANAFLYLTNPSYGFGLGNNIILQNPSGDAVVYGAGQTATFKNDGKVLIGSTTTTDPITGDSKFRIADGNQVLSFKDNGSGQGWLSVGNGTITGFVGHTSNTDGFVLGSFTNHALTLRTNNTNRIGISNSGQIVFNTSSNAYAFPTIRAASAGRVLTDVAGDGILTWETPSSGTSYTFSNGLTESGGTAKLGGTLIESTTINTGGFPTTWTGSNSNTMFSVNNSGASNAGAISGTASGTTSIGVSGSSTQYIGVFGNSTSNTGVHGQSSSGTGVLGVSSSGAAIRGQINPSSTSTIEYATTILRTSSSGAGANNMGTGTQYELETATSGTSQVAGSFAFAWDDATNATRAARYEVYTVNSGTLARKFAVKGNGQLIADTYGAGTHTVTPATTPVYSSNGTIGERVAPKIYTALISATAGNDPTVTVLGTNEIGSIVWTRSSAGVYNGTLSGAFTSNKTWITIQRGSGASGFVNGWIFNNSANVVQIQTLDNVGGTVDSFDNISFEIRVYP
jgi:hypothetical protein